MCVCVRYFVALFPCEKVLSCCSATTSDNLSSEKSDVKDTSATQKVDLGGAKALMLLNHGKSKFSTAQRLKPAVLVKAKHANHRLRGGSIYMYVDKYI